jgi:glycosyltransferase involved in cell wall biosynthesis
MTAREPRVSVLVPSRNRPGDLTRCVTSLLKSEHPSFEVVVVDQSDAATQLCADDRLVHLHSDSRGKSAGLNIAIRKARGEIVAFTDDDCTVPPDWIARVEGLFTALPDVSLLYGELRPIEHNPSEMFVPPGFFAEFQVVSSPSAAPLRGGPGGDMAARRTLFDAIGGFDELIGPGSRFKACEEFDVYYRALIGGASVAFAPDLAVLHWGGRSYADGSARALLRDYAYGLGGVMGKHLRLGDRHMLPVLARVISEDVIMLIDSVRHRRLSGFGQLVCRWRGLFDALTTRVDRAARIFVTKGDQLRRVGV